MSDFINVPEIFGSDVFNEATMKQRLEMKVDLLQMLKMSKKPLKQLWKLSKWLDMNQVKISV